MRRVSRLCCIIGCIIACAPVFSSTVRLPIGRLCTSSHRAIYCYLLHFISSLSRSPQTINPLLCHSKILSSDLDIFALLAHLVRYLRMPFLGIKEVPLQDGMYYAKDDAQPVIIGL